MSEARAGMLEVSTSRAPPLMEKKMESTIMGYIRYILGLYWDNGKENGKYYNGMYKVYFGVILG